jgi:HSP20 family protein
MRFALGVVWRTHWYHGEELCIIVDAPPPRTNQHLMREEMMATDTITSTREEKAREAGTKADISERERSLESRRESGAKRSALARRTPYFGTTSSPFHLMRTMADDIERLFSDVDFARVGFGLTSPRLAPAFEPWRGESRLAEATWAPTVETFRRDGNLVVRADLPGLSKENITIETDDDVLMISGERSDEVKDERDDFYRSERSYGRFFRAIQLPEGVNADQIEATFKDGVLEVTVPAPKVASARHRQVKIR